MIVLSDELCTDFLTYKVHSLYRHSKLVTHEAWKKEFHLNWIL
jgi:hypothetical protein